MRLKLLDGGHIDSRDCWCEPELVQPCPLCGDSLLRLRRCEKCDFRGVVPAYDHDAPVIIVHSAKERTE